MKYTVVRLFLFIYCRLYAHSSRAPGKPSFTATEATLASRHLLRGLVTDRLSWACLSTGLLFLNITFSSLSRPINLSLRE